MDRILELIFFAEPNLMRKILVAKVLIDRWGNVMTDIISHSSNKELILDELKKELIFDNDVPTIWGAALYFVDEIPKDKVLALSVTEEGELFGDVPSRAVSAFDL